MTEIDKKTLQVVEKLENIGIVPVIKLDDISKTKQLAKALVDGGIACAEVTFRAKGADSVISTMVKEFPNMVVGAGTVLTIEQADAAIKAGSHFIVAPGLNPKVAKHVMSKGVPFIPGISSASEIEQALELGIKFVKFFPAEQAGGLNYINAIAAPYSSIRFMPTGGVNENNLNSYLASPKIFACGGSWMVSADLINENKFDEITQKSIQAVDKMLGFEVAHFGINAAEEKEANTTADMFNTAFGFNKKVGSSSIFSSDKIEIMKQAEPVHGGHIGVYTNSIKRAVYALNNRGYQVDETTYREDASGKKTFVYMKDSFCGFKVHLLQKK